MEEVLPMLDDYDTLGLNYMMLHWKKDLTYAASLHYDALEALMKIRTYRNSDNRPITYGIKPHKGVDNAGRFYDGPIDTSGMYGAVVGLHLGYDKIILAGVPFDGTGHFYDAPVESKLYRSGFCSNTPYKYNWPFKGSWDKLRDKAGDRIRAVSGNLVDCFGELTEEWLRE